MTTKLFSYLEFDDSLETVNTTIKKASTDTQDLEWHRTSRKGLLGGGTWFNTTATGGL